MKKLLSLVMMLLMSVILVAGCKDDDKKGATTLEDVNAFISRFPENLKIIASEMEAFALFYMANYFKKQAACLLTVVDSHYKNQASTSEEREKSLNNIITLALESILKIK